MLDAHNITYEDEGLSFVGYIAFPATLTQPTPAILIIHDWSGRNEFACEQARKIADLGYIGFAVDMFGKGMVGTTTESKMKLMRPLMDDRNIIKKRMLKALEVVKGLDHVDQQHIVAMGFCFGGLCCLDLARTGADLAGVVSFHGLLTAPDIDNQGPILAKILALHGYQDKMVTPDQVIAFGNEMLKRQADWQLNMFGNAMHGFTNPQAHDEAAGILYNKEAATQAWRAMQLFLNEIFDKRV
ncbi:MAG: dienelactone hydrolase family protein [Gammaproteobacteria bacterium]|nr:dienelactone hydrolase family protein [Gammaproteobacteria bacterium]